MPTERRLKHLARQANKESNQRTHDERLPDVTQIRNKLLELGLTSVLDEIAAFHRMLDDFLENGTPYQGIIGIAGTGRELCYSLMNNKKHEIGVMLRANDKYL